MATYNETRSPEQIEIDIERTRSQIAETLDTLQKKFSPGQLLDRAMGYLEEKRIGENIRQFGTNAGAIVRENPIPVSLLGVGFTWLALSRRTGAKERQYVLRYTKPPRGMAGLRSQHGEVQYSGRYASETTVQGVMKERPEQTKGRLSETAGPVRETLGEKAGHVRHSVAETISGVREKAGEVSHRAQDRAARLGHAVQDQYQHVVREQPLLLGVLGLAIGVALGAAMPRTRMEDEVIGKASHWLAREGREPGQVILRAGVEPQAATGGPAHQGPTGAESGPITAASMSGEIQHHMERGETSIGTSPGGSTTGTAAGSTVTEGTSGAARSTGDDAAGASATSDMPPLDERRRGVRDRRKGSLAETIGAVMRMPPAEERRHGLPDRRISEGERRGTDDDAQQIP